MRHLRAFQIGYDLFTCDQPLTAASHLMPGGQPEGPELAAVADLGLGSGRVGLGRRHRLRRCDRWFAYRVKKLSTRSGHLLLAGRKHRMAQRFLVELAVLDLGLAGQFRGDVSAITTVDRRSTGWLG